VLNIEVANSAVLGAGGGGGVAATFASVFLKYAFTSAQFGHIVLKMMRLPQT
jgi:hypothetical protein